MAFSITTAKLTANPDESGWVQAYQFTPQDPLKLKSRGQFFAVIATSTKEEGIDAVSAGREAISRLHEEYFGNLNTPVLEALKSSVQKVVQELSSWEDLEIGSLVLLDDIVYIVVGGGARVFILRDYKLSPLIKSENVKSVAASGRPKTGDLFIIGTRSFFASFSEGFLKGALFAKRPDTIVEALAPTLHSLPRSGRVGASFIGFEKEDGNQKTIAKIESAKTELDKPVVQKNLEQPTKLESKIQLPKGWASVLIGKLLNSRQRKVYVDDGEKFDKAVSPKKKISLGVGIGLLIVLVISIIYGIREKRQRDIKTAYEDALASASHNLNEAQELHSLNPERARELLLEAREEVLGISTDGVTDSKLNDLKTKIKENEKRILGEYRIESADFVDLALLSDGFTGDTMIASRQNLYVVDKDSRKIVRVDIGNRRSEVVVGPHMVEKIEGIAAYIGRVFVVNSEGVFEVEGDALVRKIEPEWMGEVLSYSYAGNFYILDKGASTIYRYPGTEDGFGSKRDWFNEGVTFDVSGAKEWVIDGKLWVVTNEGKVLNFSLGYPQNFALPEVTPALSKIDAIFTEEESENLYLLDTENERVLVTDKSGEYKAQYIAPNISQAKGLAASEEEKKLILLTNDKLLSIDLEHL